MLKKGAVELSMNFLVIIIISITIFGFGVYFISNLASTATDITKMTTSELDSRINNLVCEGSDRVCIGTEKKVIQKKNFDVFGIKIFNILATPNFNVNVANIQLLEPGSTDLKPAPNSLNINPSNRDVSINQNEERTIAIGVQVLPTAKSGTYILDVKIQAGSIDYGAKTYKLYVVVP